MMPFQQYELGKKTYVYSYLSILCFLIIRNKVHGTLATENTQSFKFETMSSISINQSCLAIIRTNKDRKLLFPISNILPFISVILLPFYVHYCPPN